MSDLKSYLESVNCYDVEPLTIGIGKRSYKAAFYKQDRQPLPGARSQEDYTVYALYILGDLPNQYYNRNLAYVINDELWYMATYGRSSHVLLMPAEKDDRPYSLYSELQDRPKITVHQFERSPYESDDDEKVRCPICGIVRDTHSGEYRWAKRPLHSRRGFDQSCYHPQWNDGLMYRLPHGTYLPICTDRAGCERRWIENQQQHKR